MPEGSNRVDAGRPPGGQIARYQTHGHQNESDRAIGQRIGRADRVPVSYTHLDVYKRQDWMEPFARTIDAAKKYVVSSTLDRVDWNAELVRGDLGKAVQQLKRESGKGLLVGGVKLPLALAELGLIDEYEFVAVSYTHLYRT